MSGQQNAESVPWRHWHLISYRTPHPESCEHGRPDHFILIDQLARSLGLNVPALSMPPEAVWNGLLDEVERLRRRAQIDGSGPAR